VENPQPQVNAEVDTVESKPSVRGTGRGQLVLAEGTFEFELSDCTTEAFRFGYAQYDYQFRGSGLAPDGNSFNISGHRTLGTDGKQPMTMQTVFLSIDTGAAPREIPGSNIPLPARPRILEATFYFTEVNGWTRPGNRSVDGDVEVRQEAGRLHGTMPFGSAGVGELTLTCEPVQS
jgi:hypothetical protein